MQQDGEHCLSRRPRQHPHPYDQQPVFIQTSHMQSARNYKSARKQQKRPSTPSRKSATTPPSRAAGRAKLLFRRGFAEVAVGASILSDTPFRAVVPYCTLHLCATTISAGTIVASGAQRLPAVTAPTAFRCDSVEAFMHGLRADAARRAKLCRSGTQLRWVSIARAPVTFFAQGFLLRRLILPCKKAW